jgi:hypothetical protein
MGATTTYLYGDSTPSPLEMDFIAFLRDVFDFGVEVLQCDTRIAEAMRRVEALSERTDKDIDAAEVFATEVSQSLESADLGDPDSIAARCAARIRQTIHDLVRTEAEAARAAVTEGSGRAAKTATTEREACFKALEGLLLRNPLPESAVSTRLRMEGGSRYDAQLTGFVPYGLEWTMSLAIPQAHALSSILRVERVAPRLEVEAPEEGGWIHKEVKIRRQRLDRLYVSELAVEPAQTTVKLRAMPDGTGAGFDFTYLSEGDRMRLNRVREYGAAPDDPYQVVGEDAGKLREFLNALVAMVKELAAHKKALVKASFEGAAVGQLDSPRVLIDRLIANIAPKVHEIARRSLSPGELVLKRLLDDSRREELFVSKAELVDKLSALPPDARKAFDPLGLANSRSSARVAAAEENRAPKEEAFMLSARRTPAPRPAAPVAAVEPSVIVQPDSFPPGGRAPSQPPDPAAPARAAARPSQPPHH